MPSFQQDSVPNKEIEVEWTEKKKFGLLSEKVTKLSLGWQKPYWKASKNLKQVSFKVSCNNCLTDTSFTQPIMEQTQREPKPVTISHKIFSYKEKNSL